MRDWARGPSRLSTAATTPSTTAIAPTREVNGPTMSTLVTITCRAKAEAGESQGSVEQDDVTALCRSDPRALDRVRLVAPVVEHDEHVVPSHVDQLLRRRAAFGVHEADARPQEVDCAAR